MKQKPACLSPEECYCFGLFFLSLFLFLGPTESVSTQELWVPLEFRVKRLFPSNSLMSLELLLCGAFSCEDDNIEEAFPKTCQMRQSKSLDQILRSPSFVLEFLRLASPYHPHPPKDFNGPPKNSFQPATFITMRTLVMVIHGQGPTFFDDHLPGEPRTHLIRPQIQFDSIIHDLLLSESVEELLRPSARRGFCMNVN